jgi:hypothetical protein
MKLTTTCSICRGKVTIDFGGLTRDEAVAAIQKLDRNPMECPGNYHVELCGWRKWWNLDALLDQAFPTVTKNVPRGTSRYHKVA